MGILLSYQLSAKEDSFLFLWGSTRHYTSLKALEHIVSLGWLVPRPLYNLDLVLSGFHLFRPMKDGLHE